jgi:hypothetical protein
VRDRVDAPAADVGEAGPARHGELPFRRRTRAHQQATVGADELEDHGVAVDDGFAADQGQPGGVERIAFARLIEVVHRDVDHAMRALDHLAVEVVVDLPVEVPGDPEHAREPHAADPQHQRARQPVGQALGRALLRHQPEPSAKASR